VRRLLTLVTVIVNVVAGCGPAQRTKLDASEEDAMNFPVGDLSTDLTGFVGDGGAGACAAPVLLVGLENLGGGASAGGKVMRFSLSGTTVQTCSSLTGAGMLPAQPMAVAFVPPDGVAAATRDGLYLLNLDGSVRWSRPHTQLPIDVFPIVDGTGDTLVAVGYWHAGTSSPVIDHVDAHRDGTAPVFTWTMGGGFPLSSGVRAMTQSPRDPGRLFALDNPSSTTPAAAAEVNPFTPSKTAYVPYPAGQDLRTVYAFAQAGYNRTVWVDETENAIYYARENTGNAALLGPIKCAGNTCMLKHAVPDPTNPTGFLALCETAGVERDIVRFSSTGGTCDVIFPGVNAGANTRLSRLAVQLP
jgi:hypothetical protein